MSRERQTKAQDYIIKNFIKESDLHKLMAEGLKADGKFGINVSPYEGYLLQFLMKMIDAKKVVEIGTLYGYSTLWMALALPDGGRLLSFEKSPEHFEKAQAYLRKSPAGQRVELFLGPALENLSQVNFQPDFIFIDADKPNYANYLEWAMKHVAKGGLIIGDNTFLFGHLIGEGRGERTSASAIQAMSTFNTRLANDTNFRAIMIPTYEGMTIAQKI